jgi:hypothetical protein
MLEDELTGWSELTLVADAFAAVPLDVALVEFAASTTIATSENHVSMVVATRRYPS